jgi:hypothetical protein
MPEISRFFGIIVRMYFDDHEPPHFHTCYAGTQGVVGIDPICILHGDLPHRAASMVIEWAALHQRELVDNWERLHTGRPPQKVAPLP